MSNPPENGLLLPNFDRWKSGVTVDPVTGELRSEGMWVTDDPRYAGQFARRQGRFMALYMRDEGLCFQLGMTIWNVERATAKLAVVGPIYILRFVREHHVFANCRYFDWELACRGFIPAAFDFTPMSTAEDFNWGKWVCMMVNETERPPWAWRPNP